MHDDLKSLEAISRAILNPGETVADPERGFSYRVRVYKGFWMVEHIRDGQQRGVGFNFLPTAEDA